MEHGAALQIHTNTTGPGRAARAAGALLPPLALFAALLSALCAILGVSAGAPAVLCGGALVILCALLPARPAAVLRLAAAGAALALFAVPAVRDGALALANRLFAASEAVNAYAYGRFAVPDETGAALPAVAVLLGAAGSFASRRRGALLALFAGVACFGAYFGVAPGTWRGLLLFAALALPLAFDGREAGGAAALLAGAAAVALAVCLLVPRPVAAVEAYSEHLRDELSRAAASLAQGARQEREESRVHRESRQHEEAARTDDAREGTAREYARQTENERELSLPRRADWLRTVLLLLAVPALLLAPFLPFLLLGRVRRRREERRAAFAAADNASAVRAMFAHTMDWLRSGGLRTENRPYARCAEAVEALTSPEYAARYAEAARIWQEAAYSDHALTDAQRQAVRELLDATAETLYEKADRRTRFRMKYVECLCGS